MPEKVDEHLNALYTLGILIADDAFPIRNMIKYILHQKGFDNFFEASNGEQALELLRLSDIALAIVDLKMPKLNGFELIEKVKADDKLKSLPIIMITGDGSKQTVVKAFQLGASDYVLKPIDASILLKKVMKVLEKSDKVQSFS